MEGVESAPPPVLGSTKKLNTDRVNRTYRNIDQILPKILKGAILKSLYSRKLILALRDRESLSPQKFIPAKVYPIK